MLGLAACAWLATARSWDSGGVPRIVLAPLALAAIVLAQAAAGMVPYAGQALTAAFYLVWAAMLIALAAALRRELGAATVAAWLAWALLGGALAGALAGVLQHYGISTPLDAVITSKAGAAVFGNLAQPNHYATHLALGVVSAGYLWSAGRLRLAAAVPMTAILLFLLGVSGSRSAWVYLGVAAVLAAVMRGRSAADRSLFTASLCAVVAFGLAQWLAAIPGLAAPGGVVTATQKLFAGAAGITERLQLWKEAVWMISQAPLVGAGWGQFAWQYYDSHQLQGPIVAPGPFNHAHNIVLHLVAETGVLGAACVVVGTAGWLWGVARKPLDAESWWLLAVLGVLGVHSMLEYPLWYAYFLAIAAVALGLGSTAALPWGRAGGRIAAAGLLVIGTINLATVLPAYREFERFFTHRPGSMSQEALAAVVARARADPVLEPYAEMALAYAIDAEASQLREKLALLERVARFMPAEVVVYKRAVLTALDGRAAEAQQQFERALRVYPWELPSAAQELARLAPRYPRELSPLLELAAAESRRRATSPPVR